MRSAGYKGAKILFIAAAFIIGSFIAIRLILTPIGLMVALGLEIAGFLLFLVIVVRTLRWAYNALRGR